MSRTRLAKRIVQRCGCRIRQLLFQHFIQGARVSFQLRLIRRELDAIQREALGIDIRIGIIIVIAQLNRRGAERGSTYIRLQFGCGNKEYKL